MNRRRGRAAQLPRPLAVQVAGPAMSRRSPMVLQHAEGTEPALGHHGETGHRHQANESQAECSPAMPGAWRSIAAAGLASGSIVAVAAYPRWRIILVVDPRNCGGGGGA